MNTNMSSQGTALITGASSGIGAIYADRLARRGHDLILVARDRQKLDEVAARLMVETGRSARFIVADLSNKADLALVEQVLRTDLGITLLLNNAGVAKNDDLADADPDMLERMIQVNILAPTRLASAALPGFIARGYGTVINISSALALAPELLDGCYSGTKAYMLNLSLRLQKEVAGKGIRVQVVMPGAVRTPIWDKAGTDIASLPPAIVMDADKMVDAALAGLDLGEVVTIPSLPDMADWEVYEAVRQNLIPKLSLSSPAPRYNEPSGRAQSQTAQSAETRLAASGIDLPPAVTPFGAYVPAVQTGNLLFLSGMLPSVGHEPKFLGRVGRELNTEQGRSAAYATALNVLAVARQHLGSLDRVSRVVRLGVYIATAGDFVDLVKIADAASDLLREIFGEDKMSSRLVFGVERLPLGAPVELEAVFEVR